MARAEQVGYVVLADRRRPVSRGSEFMICGTRRHRYGWVLATVFGVEPPIGIEPMTHALRGARDLVAYALAQRGSSPADSE
jgi:hypothetical protein